jgi:hypothetical protein
MGTLLHKARILLETSKSTKHEILFWSSKLKEISTQISALLIHEEKHTEKNQDRRKSLAVHSAHEQSCENGQGETGASGRCSRLYDANRKTSTLKNDAKQKKT